MFIPTTRTVLTRGYQQSLITITLCYYYEIMPYPQVETESIVIIISF